MLSVAKYVASLLTDNPIEQFAERVACRSRMAVWQRVSQRLALLGPTEGRGYLRARASGIVHEETVRLVEQEGTKVAALRGQIEEAALSRLVTMLTLQMSQRRMGGVRVAA